MLVLIWLSLFPVLAQTPDVTPLDIERLGGFAEHKKIGKEYDKNREDGYREYLKDLEDWEAQRRLAIKEQQSLRKEKGPSDDIQAYRQDLAEKVAFEHDLELSRRQFIAEKKLLSQNPLLRQMTEEEELEIYMKRPRFDHKKRALYSSKGSVVPEPTKTRKTTVRPQPSGGSDSFAPPPPPPPTFDDYPPPPPPPAFGEGNVEEFPPPPPMPQPGSFEEYDDFPPPPPPPPADYPPPPDF